MSNLRTRRCSTPVLMALGLTAMLAIPVSSSPGRAQPGPPRVVVTIAPVHSLAASVMEGVGSPELLIKSAFSEHTYALKPSDARKLNEADIVVRVAPNLESFLDNSLESLPKATRIINLNAEPGMVLWPVRAGGDFEPHDHHDDERQGDGHGHEKEGGHDHGAEDSLPDPHTWLDPRNAALMADKIGAALIELDPSHADRYRQNLAVLKTRLSALDDELRARLRPLHDKPYVVFHDAYQYFERRYELSPVGSVSLSSAQAPGAKHLDALRQKIRSLKAVCVFTEPQFDPKLANALVERTGARTATLDGLGADLTIGPELYFNLLHKLVQNLTSCVTVE